MARKVSCHRINDFITYHTVTVINKIINNLISAAIEDGIFHTTIERTIESTHVCFHGNINYTPDYLSIVSLSENLFSLDLWTQIDSRDEIILQFNLAIASAGPVLVVPCR